eukprot:Tbor_TRINITY_DN4892_c1_g1::TRINITY_DN4892_c1_g1_i1::g.1386::m.1386/K00699/UGT; glucuronosyltransferase
MNTTTPLISHMMVITTLLIQITGASSIYVDNNNNINNSDIIGRTGLTFGFVPFPEWANINPCLALVQKALTDPDDINNDNRVVIYLPGFPVGVRKTIANMIIDLIDDEEERRNGLSEVEIKRKKEQIYSRVRFVTFKEDCNAGEVSEDFLADMVASSATASLTTIMNKGAPFIRNFTIHFYNELQSEQLHRVNGGNPDIFIVDSRMYGPVSVLEKLDIPKVVLWPVTLSLPYNQNFYVPFISFGFPFRMNFFQRIINIVAYTFFSHVLGGRFYSSHINKLRREVLQMGPVDQFELLGRNPVITPNVYGFDISQPLCPNVFPVGLLLPVVNKSVDTIPKEWQDWLDGCTQGVIYVNMGSIALLLTFISKPIDYFIHNMSTTHCVVLKRTQSMPFGNVGDSQSTNPNVRIEKHFPFTPRALLGHKHVSVFVTHCGDTSAYEAISEQVPMVGIPILAEQPNVCARVEDSGIGFTVDKYLLHRDNGTTLIKRVRLILNNPVMHLAMRRRMDFMYRTSLAQGGAETGISVVKKIWRMGSDGVKTLNCKNIDEPMYRILELDVYVLYGVVSYCMLLLVKYLYRWLWSMCFCSKKKKNLGCGKSQTMKKMKVE